VNLKGVTEMGYFANLYVVEASASENAIEIETSIYAGVMNPMAYFSWRPGVRTGRLRQYANGTLFSDSKLRRLPGYPMKQRIEESDLFLLEAGFAPMYEEAPVLFHIILPEFFIPRRDYTPFIQPCDPFAYINESRFVITYPAKGATEIRFWASRIRESESLSDFDITKVLKPEVKDSINVKFEINLGFFKVEIS
jgi:hypothetical protein